MHRRTFLKAGVAAATSLLVGNVTKADGSGGVQRRQDILFGGSPAQHMFESVNKIFTMVEILPGETSEFPLDIGSDSHVSIFGCDEAALPAAASHVKICSGHVHVPMKFYGAWGQTQNKAELNFCKKLNQYICEVLLASSQQNCNFPANSRSELCKLFVSHFGHERVGLIEHDGWLIGIDKDVCKYHCVIPYRHWFEAYPDELSFIEGYHGFAELGIAVLDNRVAACGRIS